MKNNDIKSKVRVCRQCRVLFLYPVNYCKFCKGSPKLEETGFMI